MCVFPLPGITGTVHPDDPLPPDPGRKDYSLQTQILTSDNFASDLYRPLEIMLIFF